MTECVMIIIILIMWSSSVLIASKFQRVKKVQSIKKSALVLQLLNEKIGTEPPRWDLTPVQL